MGKVISCWMLLVPSTLHGTQDSWVLLSLLVWGTAKADTHTLIFGFLIDSSNKAEC